MTWVLGWLYLRKADRVFDPLAKRAAEQAVAHGRGQARPDGDERAADENGGTR